MAKAKKKKELMFEETEKYILESLNVMIKGKIYLKQDKYIFDPHGKDSSIKDEIFAAAKSGYLVKVK